MTGERIIAFCGPILCSFYVLLVLSPTVHGERLPIKTYTSADGLANSVVKRIVRDSRGYLWFCTREGLSRFDGYSFTSYGIEHGLPSAIVNDLLETREGIYLVATSGGLCRFNPRGVLQKNKEEPADPIFTVYHPGEDTRARQVLTLFQDRSGVIWCVPESGVRRAICDLLRPLIRRYDTNRKSHACSEKLNVGINESAVHFHHQW